MTDKELWDEVYVHLVKQHPSTGTAEIAQRANAAVGSRKELRFKKKSPYVPKAMWEDLKARVVKSDG